MSSPPGKIVLMYVQEPLSFMDFFVYTYGDEQGDVVVLLLRICLVCK